MSVDILRVENNERVDIDDFQFISESILDQERQIVDNLVCDPGRTRKWVLSGFAMSNPAASQLKVTRGKAILGQRISGVVEYGILTTEGDADQTVDLNGWAAGTYGIYIRFERIESESDSRTFWNSGGGSEYSQTINTRYTAGWSVKVESSSPGDEWLKIGEVAQATMTITDQRNFFFEGDASDSYASGWSSDGSGSANDRNSDRAAYGVTDLQMFSSAMRQCITDIKGRGLREWYERDIGGMNIGFDADPVEDRLAVGDADFHMLYDTADSIISFDTNDDLRYSRAGNQWQFLVAGSVEFSLSHYTFTSFSEQDLGSSSRLWGELYINKINLEDTAENGFSNNVVPTMAGFGLGNATYFWGVGYINTIYPSSTAGKGCGGSWNPTVTDQSYDLGSSTYRWGSIYGGEVFAYQDDPKFTLYDTAETTTDAHAFQIANFTTGDGGVMLRFTDDALSHFGNILKFNRDSTTVYKCTSIESLVDFLPDSGSAGTLDLGSATAYWDNIYSKAVLAVNGGLRSKTAGTDTGLSGYVTYTGVNVVSGVSTGVGDIKMQSTNSATNAGWLKIYLGTDDYFIPIWADMSP